MDPASTVEDTERTWFCPQMDRRTRWNQYTPLNFAVTDITVYRLIVTVPANDGQYDTYAYCQCSYDIFLIKYGDV